MSASNFQIQGGDLVVGPGRTYQRVTDLAKLQQDLELWILERIGTDPATPTYGTTLDGGVIDGQPVESFIGQMVTQARVQEITAEIRRVLELFQQTQLTKMQNEMALYRGKHTLSGDEILASIDNIQAAVMSDLVVVQVQITTASNTSLTLTVPTQI